MADGFTVFVCGGPRPPGCSAPACTAAGTLSCGHALGGAKAGTTCARPLCGHHAHPNGAGVVLCPAHRRLAARGGRAG